MQEQQRTIRKRKVPNVKDRGLFYKGNQVSENAFEDLLQETYQQSYCINQHQKINGVRGQTNITRRRRAVSTIRGARKYGTVQGQFNLHGCRKVGLEWETYLRLKHP